MLNLRNRIIIGSTLAVAIVGTLSALIVGSVAYELAQSRFKDALHPYALDYVHAVNGKGDVSAAAQNWNQADPPSVWVFDSNGDVKASTGLLAQMPVPPLPDNMPDSIDRPRTAWGELPSGQAALFMRAIRRDPQTKTIEFSVIAIRPAVNMHADQRQFKFMLIIAILVTCILVAIAMRLLTRVILRPVDQLAQAMEQDPIATREPTPISMPQSTPAELAVLWQRLNEMTQRIKQTVARERRVSADIAHELRSPLAGLRVQLDVALTRQREPEELQCILRSSSKLVNDLQQMVEKLMLLSRIEYGQVPLHRESIRIDDLIDEASDRLNPAYDRNWHISGPSDTNISCDIDLMSLVIANLLENAANYGSDKKTININIENGPSGPILSVSNPIEQAFSEETLKQLAEPFYRSDESRHEAARHSGLGLALCKRIIELHGFTLHIEQETLHKSATSQSMFHVRCDLPSQ